VRTQTEDANPLPPRSVSAQTADNSAPTRSRFFFPALAALITFAVFSLSFGHEFVDWDDMEYVVKNPLLLYPAVYGYADCWKTIVALNYHPLTMMSLMANARWFGMGPGSFIVTNVLIHSLNTVLVYWLANRLSGQNAWVAFFTALLWGIHPMHVESVVWVSERKDVLYTLFFLAACLTYLRYKDQNRASWFWATFGLFVLACLSKGMAVVLPVVLLLLDYWVDTRVSDRRAVVQKLPFFLVSLLFGWIAVTVQSGDTFYGMLTILEQKEAIGQDPFSWRWFVYGSFGFLLYVLKLLVPVQMAAFYPYPDDVTQIPGLYWLGPVALLATLSVLVWAVKTGHRLLVFGLGFFLVTIALVLQFMTVGAAVMADRYSYLAYFGLLFLLVTAVNQYVPSALMSRAVLGVFAVVCLFLTVQQIKTWQTTETLWNHALQFSPNNDQLLEGLGSYYGQKNDLDKAQAMYEEALKNGTTRFQVYNGLGNVYGLKGDPERAAKMFDEALRIKPDHSDTHYNRGLTLMRVRPADALASFNAALKYAPQNDTLIVPTRAFAALQAKQYQAAITDYTQTIAWKPNDAIAYHNRGVCRFNLGDKAGAIADIRKSLALDPNYSEAVQNLKAIEGR
jgi:protein O-mannosyl-transferase